MTVSVVQSKIVRSNVNPATLAFDSDVTPGNTVVVISASGYVTSVSDNQGNTYDGPYGTVLDVTSGQNIRTHVARNVAASGTFEVSFDAIFVSKTLCIVEVAGLGDNPQETVVTDDTGTSDPTVGPTATIPIGDSIAFAGIVYITEPAGLAEVSPLTALQKQSVSTPVISTSYVPAADLGRNPGTLTVGWTDTAGSYTSARTLLVLTKELQIVRPVATDTAGNWTAEPSGTLHGNVADDDDATYDQLLAANSPSKLSLTFDTLDEPGSGDGALTIRAKR